MLCSVFEGFMNKLMSGSWAFGNDELLREESDAVDGLVENFLAKAPVSPMGLWMCANENKGKVRYSSHTFILLLIIQTIQDERKSWIMRTNHPKRQ